jgi:hypothetical protein
MTNDSVRQRMAVLMEPIDQQIMMCDNREELLMLACAMLTSVKDIFDQEIGEPGRRHMFRSYE